MRRKTDLPTLRIYLRANNRPLTIERRGMLSVIASMKGQYSAEDFFKEARKKDAICSKTTVYRSMPLFVDAGFVEEIRLPNGRRLYKAMQDGLCAAGLPSKVPPAF